jgi:hypothetical protein
MTGSQRPTPPSRSISPDNDLGALLIDSISKTLERRGQLVGDQATVNDRRAEIHNLIWSWWPEREVTPLVLALNELADAIVNIGSAQKGQEGVVLAQQISNLAVLATTFMVPPSQPETKSEPETRPAPVTAPTRLTGMGLTSAPRPEPTETGNAA